MDDSHSKYHSANSFCGSAGPEESRHMDELVEKLSDDELKLLVKKGGINFEVSEKELKQLERDDYLGVVDEIDREGFYREYRKIIESRKGSVSVVLVITIAVLVVAALGFIFFRSQPTGPARQAGLLQKKTVSEPDSVSTLSNPTKIATSDGKHSFLYGEPAGQNNKTTRKVIFNLPGHGTTAKTGYDAWRAQLTANGTYAFAVLDWWDGKGETNANYLTPDMVQKEIKYFMDKLGYKTTDLIILSGFSRGSANTYPVELYDIASGKPVFDGVLSASGKYEPDYAVTPELLNQKGGKPFSGVAWILVCGGKDPNPDRDGCPGMTETQTFLKEEGANVLGFLTDPNSGHGVLNLSKLNLAEKAMDMFDTLLTK